MSPRVRAAALLAAVAMVGGVLSVIPGPAGAAAPDEAPSLIIVSGRAMATKKTLRIATSSVEWLSERPTPGKGAMTPGELVEHWDAYGFDARHPRASIAGRDIDAPVRLSHQPEVDGDSVTFPIVAVDGTVPRGSLGRIVMFVDAEPPSLLYLQDAQSGTFEQAGAGSMTLTLDVVSPRTFYFSDRPDRVSGSLRTEDFARLETVFTRDDPPNAAVVLSDAQAEEDVVVVTLANPRYDAPARTISYDATFVDDVPSGLANWEGARDESVPSSFGQVSLYIDNSQDTECPGQVSWADGSVVVTATDDKTRQPLEGVDVKLFATDDTADPDYTGTTDAAGKLSLSVLPTDAYVQDYYRTTITIDGYVPLQEQLKVCPDQIVPVTADLDRS